jgi:hypothetical protein
MLEEACSLVYVDIELLEIFSYYDAFEKIHLKL